MLEVRDIHTNYGASRVLHGVSLQVEEGSVVALLGRNGAGKTTTLRSVVGLTPPRRGRITFNGRDMAGRKPHQAAGLGISYMPETRGIFPSLSVEENLTLVQGRRRGDWTLDKVYGLFPRLKSRRSNGGAQLSGGEQQMLAIARALLLNPDLLILDEPTEGLAPIVVQEIQETLHALKHKGMTILLVEQNFKFATDLADQVFVLGKGQIQAGGASADIVADKALQKKWLGV